MMSVEDVDTAIKASVNIGATLQQLSVWMARWSTLKLYLLVLQNSGSYCRLEEAASRLSKTFN